jgi:hypothetical protein
MRRRSFGSEYRTGAARLIPCRIKMDEPWINKKQKTAGGHQVMMNSQTETEIRNEKQKKQYYVDRRW